MKAVIFMVDQPTVVENVIEATLGFVQAYYPGRYLMVESDVFVEPGEIYDSVSGTFSEPT